MLQVKKVNPGDIPNIWGKIKEAIKVGLPPTMDNTDEACDAVFGNLVQDKMQLWFAVDDNDKSTPVAMAITEIVGEPGYAYRNLLVYVLVAFRSVSLEEWRIGFDVIKAFAKREGCRKILGFTNIKRIVDIVQSFGGKAEFVLVTMEV